MASQWKPLPDGRELHLYRGKRGHDQSNYYIATAKTVAGRILPDGYAVCQLVEVPDAPPSEVVQTIRDALKRHRGAIESQVRNGWLGANEYEEAEHRIEDALIYLDTLNRVEKSVQEIA